ncbi:MAG: hypothetical protein ACRD0Z_15245 [Acidimicrobiales bacterium]
MRDRDDSGQAALLVLVLVLLLAVLGPLVVSEVTSDTGALVRSTNKHAALSAAEAGIQWYRNNLDAYPSYYQYSASNLPSTGDAALSGYCGSGLSSTCGLGGASPAEAFHYVPDSSHLSTDGTVQVTVTGRGGSAGNYSYVTAEASLSVSSPLSDAYFSNYEVEDPNDDTVQGYNVTTKVGGVETTPPETAYEISYSYTIGGVATAVNHVSVWTALCLYDTYSPNLFVDSLGITIGGTAYSPGHPYYGPYQTGSILTFYVSGSGVVSPSGPTEVDAPSDACGVNYDFVDGESFDGPVYTNDQLHVCGRPDFEGSPVSLTSGAPSDVPYLYDVPGSVKVTAANSGANGPYPTADIGDYMPAGYTVDTLNCGEGDDPVLAHGPVALNGEQSLPALNTSLGEYGTDNPPSGTIGTGCTYVGPTMIELVTSGGTTLMDVWSPLSTNTSVTSSTCSGGQTFSATKPLIDGIPLPTDGVVYVQDYVLTSGAPAVPSDGASPCFNPYRSDHAVTNSQCYEGDVYVEGELSGQLTIGSAANIMITRNLTYACADGAGGASAIDPSSVAACRTSTPDILGLSAQQDVLVSGNDPSNADASSTNCTYDGTGTPTNSGTRLGGTSYPLDPAGVWPWLCNPDNVIVDAVVLAEQGALQTENWKTTPYSGNVRLNGSDLSYYRGPFGQEGLTGFDKTFSYDTRLQYVTPPYALPDDVLIWQVEQYVVCPDPACSPLN